MDLKEIHKIYFIGIGGIGMSALARYFKAIGRDVSGYDKTPTALTRSLEAEGIAVYFDDNVDRAPKDADLVVFTPAIPQNHRELNYFQSNNYPVMKRSEVLGLITENTYTIAVAGTHGKTTTSSIIAHILKYSNVDCTAFLGGILQGYESNLLLSGDLSTTVVEADEYDRSFLTLAPDIAIVTSMDADHLDIYGSKNNIEESFTLFAQKVSDNGLLIFKKGLEFSSPVDRKSITYSLSEIADYYAQNITVKDGLYEFDVVTATGSIEGLQLGIPGRHNIENALAAIAVAFEMGVSETDLRNALQAYKGVKRRFEYLIKTDRLVFIDDYAHHPAELTACIGSVREMYPERKITGIFQPHLFSRTRDFEDEFARSLELLDQVILLDIYPAREAPIEGVTSGHLLSKIGLKEKSLESKSSLLSELENSNVQVLLTLGAGDIDELLDSIKSTLLTKIEN